MARTKSASLGKLPSSLASRRVVIRSLISLALIILIVSVWAWWRFVHSNPRRVFAGMLTNSLQSTGITDRLQESNGTQGLDQTIQLLTAPLHQAHAITVLSQKGDSGASVTTETIGMPSTDFVQYLDVKNTAKSADGKQPDFSKVKNIWGKSNSDSSGDQTAGQLYNQSVLAVVPVGNLPANERQALLGYIESQKVYSVDYAHVERNIKNGRPEYTYKVSIKPEPYVSMLKAFAHDIGLNQLENVEPANYSNTAPVEVSISIDVWTRSLRGITYAGSPRTESFSAYGAQRPAQLPSKTVPIEELQSRIQSLQ